MATEVLMFSSMDFALVAPELSMSALPITSAPAIESNGEWMLNWLEVAPPLGTAGLAEVVSRTIARPVNTVAAPVPEWLLGMTPVEPETSVPVELAGVGTEAVLPPELTPLLGEARDETVDEDSEDESDAEEAPVTMTMSTPTASTMPIVVDTAAARPTRSLDIAPRRSKPDQDLRSSTPAPADKGELIWTAELVAEAPPDRVPVLTRPDPAIRSEEASPALVRPASDARQFERGDSQESKEPAPSAEPELKRKAAPSPDGKIEPIDKPEPEPRAFKHAAPIELRAAAAPAAHPLRAPIEAPTEVKVERAEGTATVEAIAPAQRLRPTQVARVQVDLAGPGQAPGADPAMRLVLTQRGENVSVQLRSWNESVAPLPAADVQPLLDNLAKQGLAPAPDVAATIETPKERQIVLNQSAASQQDARGFQGYDERQQRQQEQHRQQQEVFTRRQQRVGAEFNLQAAFDEVHTR